MCDRSRRPAAPRCDCRITRSVAGSRDDIGSPPDALAFRRAFDRATRLVADIGDIFGTYASASAKAGAGNSASAQAMTKGEVSLALTGKGQGIELGVSFGKFTITRK